MTAISEINWQIRCFAAERALRAARAGLPITQVKRAVLARLGDLKPSETVRTGAIASDLLQPIAKVQRVLSELEEVGLVDRAGEHRGSRGNQAQWRLGYLVEIPSEEGPPW